MVKLNKISLEGYKSIKQCRDLKLEKLNVLIGGNGSGKSNFLSFFKLLNFEMMGALQEFIGRNGGRDSLLHLGAKVTPHIMAELEMTSELGTYSYRMRLTDAAPDTLMFTEESVFFCPFGTNTPVNRSYLGVGKESALLSPAEATNPTAQFFKSTILKFRYYQFHDTSDKSRMRSRDHLGNALKIEEHGGQVAANLWMLREAWPERYQRVVETIHLVFPIFKDFVLEPDYGGGNYLMLRWRAVGSAEYEFGLHQLSDGTLRFIALATLLFQPNELMPPLITIDEPELGLHPFAIKILASLLVDASQRTQLLVATQSAALVDELTPEEVIVANLDEEGATSLERLDSEKLADWLKEYSLSQMWETNIFGGLP